MGQEKTATIGVKCEGQADSHLVVWSPWLVCVCFVVVFCGFFFFFLYFGFFCWTYRTWMGLLTLFLITDLGSHLPLGFKDGQGPILQLRVLCSDNGTCKVEPNGSCHGSSSSHLWDARSLTCVSSWFRQQSICCLTCEYSWQGPESIERTRSEWSCSWGKVPHCLWVIRLNSKGWERKVWVTWLLSSYLSEARTMPLSLVETCPPGLRRGPPEENSA